MAANGYVPIPGSERLPMPGATQTGPCEPTESIQITVVLRPRPLAEGVKPLNEVVASGERVTRSEYEERYGANAEDVRRVEEFAMPTTLKLPALVRAREQFN